jgi:hypothetical protein
VTDDPAVLALRALGVEPGQRVRFRRRAGEHWQEGVATRREKDGSIGLVDGKGAARAIPVDRLEVCRPGRRGAVRWEALADVAAREEQLGLFRPEPDPGGHRRRR